MFNDIYCVNLGNLKFAVKSSTLASEVLFIKPKGDERYLLAELSDELRALILELNEINRSVAA